MFRRICSVLLCLCLVLVMMPVPTARAETQYKVSLLKQSYDNPNHDLWLGRSTGSGGEYQPGETVTITAPSKAGFQFQKWADLSGLTIIDGSENTEVIKFVMPGRDVSLEALYYATGPIHQVKQIDNVHNGAKWYSYNCATGSEFVAVAHQIDGYQHEGWEETEGLTITYGGKDTPGNLQFIMPDRDVTLIEIYSPFVDVHKSNYFFDPVLWAVNKGITKGTSDTTFSPNNTCTVAQILTFLWRVHASQEPHTPNPFTDFDVNENGDFMKAAIWAYERGMVTGTTFRGNVPCTRAATMKYFWIMFGKPSAGASSFTDVPSDADYAQAVAWAVQAGITNGKTETTFAPNETCTRAQIVTFLYRVYK